MNVRSKLGALLPDAFIDYAKLQRVRRNNPTAAYINSPFVSPGAVLGKGVGIGRDVVVNAEVRLDAGTYVNRGSILFSGTIGRYCSIGHYVLIGGENHPLDHLSTSPRVRGASTGFNEIPAPPQIGSDVWIAARAIVLQGVSIGHGAVVASGAVVTRDVEPYAIVAGVPARKIGQRFPDATIANLLAWKWWEKDMSDAAVSDALNQGSSWAHSDKDQPSRESASDSHSAQEQKDRRPNQ